MDHLLGSQIDIFNLNVIKNSMLFRETGGDDGRTQYRERYMINNGSLYQEFGPTKFEELKKTNTAQEMVHSLKDTPYMKMIHETRMGDQFDAAAKEVDDSNDDGYEMAVNKHTTRLLSMAFENGFHVGAFYAYIQLRLQEIKQVTFFADLMNMKLSKNHPAWDKFIVPFQYHYNGTTKQWE